MLFTTLGRIVATLTLLLGIMRVALGFVVAWSADPAAAGARYLGSSTSGEAIDRGLMTILVALALGVLTDISRNLLTGKK